MIAGLSGDRPGDKENNVRETLPEMTILLFSKTINVFNDFIKLFI